MAGSRGEVVVEAEAEARATETAGIGPEKIIGAKEASDQEAVAEANKENPQTYVSS